ncbi:VOC family protein [Micromonospora chokoriensis]
MAVEHPAPVVRQLRLVVEAEDYEAAVAFFRDALGLPEEAEFVSDGDARVMILDAGRATLELANPAQKRMIDEVEVGRQVAPRMRVAFEVDDAEATTFRLVAAGASEVAPPTRTPWDSLNSRLDAPAGLHITVFQELLTPDEGSGTRGAGPDGTPERAALPRQRPHPDGHRAGADRPGIGRGTPPAPLARARSVRRAAR